MAIVYDDQTTNSYSRTGRTKALKRASGQLGDFIIQSHPIHLKTRTTLIEV